MPGFGVSVPGFGFSVPGFGVSVPGFGFSVPGFSTAVFLPVNTMFISYDEFIIFEYTVTGIFPSSRVFLVNVNTDTYGSLPTFAL